MDHGVPAFRVVGVGQRARPYLSPWGTDVQWPRSCNIDDEERFRDVLRHLAETFVAFAQRFFRQFALRDIAVVRYERSHRRIVEEIPEARFKPSPAPVAVTQAHLDRRERSR